MFLIFRKNIEILFVLSQSFIIFISTFKNYQSNS